MQFDKKWLDEGVFFFFSTLLELWAILDIPINSKSWLVQELPESQRADAVSSMVYEASARIRDPVYGCAGAICQLQKQINELQAQLAKAKAQVEVANMQLQQANLAAFLCMEMAESTSTQPNSHQFVDNPSFMEDNNFGSFWEPLPLWTWYNASSMN